MAKVRKVLKYSTAGAVTALYLTTIYSALTSQDDAMDQILAPKKAAVIAGLLTAATWLAVAL